jgi:hypothetical protein
MEERVKIGDERLPITKMSTLDNSGINVTGAYIWKVDRTNPAGTDAFTAGRVLRCVEFFGFFSGFDFPRFFLFLKSLAYHFFRIPEVYLLGPELPDYHHTAKSLFDQFFDHVAK